MTDQSDDELAETEVRIRRAPRYSRFLIAGAALGAIAGLAGTTLFPIDPAVGVGAMLGYLLVFGVAAGLGLGAIVAVLLEARASRRATTVTAGKMRVQTQPGEQNPAQRPSAAEPEAHPESDDGQS
jgi:hypothetical protein